ncbi:MAG: hypothetical protein M0Z71_14120 [Nitrospiraceae bacterium]|nr:hypothetical protein [Nitrospiraceae bacterium]
MERVRYRQAKFDAYFRRRLSAFLLRADKVMFLRGDRPFSPEEEIVSEGSLVGLNQGRNTLAVGAVAGAYPRAVALLAPLRSLQKVDRILFGEIVYDLKNSLR